VISCVFTASPAVQVALPWMSLAPPHRLIHLEKGNLYLTSSVAVWAMAVCLLYRPTFQQEIQSLYDHIKQNEPDMEPD
jgi:hypothetical protein